MMEGPVPSPITDEPRGAEGRPRESLGGDVADPVGLLLAEPAAPASVGTWVGRRARNAARRTALIGIAGGLVFVGMLVTLIVIPHRARRAAAAIMPRPGERPEDRKSTRLNSSH